MKNKRHQNEKGSPLFRPGGIETSGGNESDEKHEKERTTEHFFWRLFFGRKELNMQVRFFIGLIPCISRFRKKVLRWRRRCRRNLLNPLCDCLNGGSFSQHRPIFLPITCICCCILLSLSLFLFAPPFFSSPFLAFSNVPNLHF